MMVLEHHVLPYLDWLTTNIQFLGLVAVCLFIGGAFVGYLFSAAQHGPFQAIGRQLRMLFDAINDLRNLSLRRLMAMAKLAFKESLRRNVLVVFFVFVVILLLTGWYLSADSDHPGRLYISFVIKATNFLTILMAIFLSSFSLPNDMKNKTIFTVVTKPVRPWEIILGRVIGFAAIGSVLLTIMCLFSYVFVVRGLNHQHVAEVDSLVPMEENEGILQGRTSMDARHRHELSVGGTGDATDARSGHWHPVEQQGDTITIGKPDGFLEARVPVYGQLRFLDRNGRPADLGINVGKEWTYRGYVEGRTLSAGIWRFENLDPRDYTEALPIEMAIRVFRTYTGKIESGIGGTIRILNGDPKVHEAALMNTPEARRGFDPDTAVESEPIFFYAQEFTPESRNIDRKIKAKMLDGSIREVDIFEAFAQSGALEIKIQCEERSQYYGMAQADLYIRAADNWFGWNFVKAFITMWLQMLVVTSFGVMFSTFLTGSVAMLSTVFALVMGYFSETVMRVATKEQQGGGPIESVVRVFRQDNMVREMEPGLSTTIIQAFDVVAMLVMWTISMVMPNFRDFAEHGGINTTRFVAFGFDIPGDLMWQHVTISLLFVLITSTAGYFFLKSKEVAA